MAVKRLPRGTRIAPARVAWEVEGARKEMFDRMATRAGMSSAYFFEEVVKHLETELTDRGIPAWMPQPDLEDGELPINSA